MAINHKQSDFSPVSFPVTAAAVQEEVAALRRILLKAEEAFAPLEAEEDAIHAEVKRLTALEERERALIQRGQGSRDKAREYHQASNREFKKLTDRFDGLWGKWEYTHPKAELESARRRQTDFETLLAEWRALEVIHNAEVAKAAAEAAAKAAEEAAASERREAAYRAEIASRPPGWELFRWNGKDYDGDRIDD
jgi:chromosome segregation ATPase